MRQLLKKDSEELILRSLWECLPPPRKMVDGVATKLSVTISASISHFSLGLSLS
jgi:hypothetical protein